MTLPSSIINIPLRRRLSANFAIHPPDCHPALVIPERRSLIRVRNEWKRLPFYDPGSRFAWPG